LVLPPLPDDFKDLLEDIDLDDLNITDLDDLKDLGIDIDDIQQEDLDELAQLVDDEDIADFLEEMNDGDIDNFDLTETGLIIAALLFSDVEVFRVYEYDNPVEDRENILWRYECFDQFNGDGWESTVPMEQNSFLTFEDYYDNFFDSGYDLIKLKRQLSAIIGANSFVLGSLFPNPYIIEDSIDAPNLDQAILFSDDFGCVSADLFFSQAGDLDMLYNLFGLNLPTNDEINATAQTTNYNPSDPGFQKFLQIPGGVSGYINNNNFFRTHWNTLNTIITSQDNAFMVANKIRNYLQSNFDLSFDALVNDPPGEGEDVVEWFCEHGEGLYSEFASAFVVFARSFGVASRFVDGFNSRLISEMFDSDENEWTYPIKYKNIYNWAEIYVPWDKTRLSGHGRWVQMDILYDSYGPGGSPVTLEDFNLTVATNSSLYTRGQVANITAILSSSETNVDGREITFRDITTGQNLGTYLTDANGIASILVNIDNNFIAGPNIIEASHQNFENYTYFVVDEKVGIILSYVYPQEVNISIDPTIRIRGFVEDYTTSNPIENAVVNFVLFYKGTNNRVPNAFNPITAITGSDGWFDINVDVQEYVQYGEYELRADFNGTWIGFPPFPIISASSNRLYLNVTKELTYSLLFSINGQPTDYPADPDSDILINLKRSEQVNLSVIVLDEEDNSPAPDVLVEFYDYTNGDVLIGTDISDFNGYASILYTIGNTHKSGPTLVYTRVGSTRNYSYYIVNESIKINIISGPNPRQIDLYQTTSDSFNINGNVTDNEGNSVGYTEIKLRLFNKDGIDYTDYLIPYESNPYVTGNDGSFSLNFQVDPNNVPAGNYSLRLDFNGSFLLTNDPNNDYDFNFVGLYSLDYLSNSTVFEKELKIFDPDDIKVFLKVDGDPTPNPNNYDEINEPKSYIRGIGQVSFQITINQSGSGVESGYVTILDEYSGRYLYNYTYDGTEIPKGYVQIDIPTINFWSAGIHKIRVRYMDFATTNITYIIINETININPNPVVETGGIDNVIIRDNGGFTVNGFIWENGTVLRGLIVKLLLFDKNGINVSDYLIGNPYALTNEDGNFTIQIDRINGTAPYGEYFLRIDFNGSINIFDTPGIDLIRNYMISGSSKLVPLNITAGTSITIVDYYTNRDFPPLHDNWVNKSILTVIGDLYWDNSSFINGMIVNVTVQLLDGTIIAYNDTAQTNPSGRFTANLLITDDWPDLRSDTKIVVYFDSKVNNLIHVEDSNDTAYP